MNLESINRSGFCSPRRVPAKGVLAIETYGNTFYVVSAPVPLQIKTTLTAEKAYCQGTGEVFADGLVFERIEVRNDTTADVTVTIYAGFGQYLDRRAYVIDKPTEVQAIDLPGKLLGANAVIDLPGVPSGNRTQRRCLYVSNSDPTNLNIEIIDSAGRVVNFVYPTTSSVVVASGPLGVRNPNPTAIQAAISETWYVENL